MSDEPLVDPDLSAGDQVTCALEASDVPLTMEGLGEVALEFSGETTLQVEDNPPDTDGIEVSVPAFELKARSPDLGLVTITITEARADPTVAEVAPTDGEMAELEHEMLLNFTVTVENPPEGDEPLVLTATQPARLLTRSLTAFPPQGSVYQLQEPIDLTAVGDPSTVCGQLQQFPVTVSHNP